MTKPAATPSSIPALALLPLRLFFGATFLWAGLDKLLDPTFFDAAAATSLHAQLVDFARQSPLGDLIRASLPLATPIGLLIAVGELGVGIGALTGLAFRLAAAGGAALSLLFWLSASWPTHPYYFGADLPYMLGWITLAIAGHGNLLVPARLRTDRPTDGPGATDSRARREARREHRRDLRRDGRRAAPAASWAATSAPPRSRPRVAESEVPPSPERRMLLEAGALAGIAAIVASLTAPLRAMGIASEPTPAPTPLPTVGASGATPTPVAAGSAAPGATGGRLAVARVADVTRAGSAAFTVPFDAPAPLPAGDPGIVIRLSDGSFVGFDAVCTHAGCTVEYDPSYEVIFCPCHGAEFDPAHAAAVIAGPTRQPLAKLPLQVDPATGTISLSTS
ncbi:MAG TPA: ubiquinol-cytochrome c reductase iron-sulfur subunit [Candidatus Limnocylindrales bacterium]